MPTEQWIKKKKIIEIFSYSSEKLHNAKDIPIIHSDDNNYKYLLLENNSSNSDAFFIIENANDSNNKVKIISPSYPISGVLQSE